MSLSYLRCGFGAIIASLLYYYFVNKYKETYQFQSKWNVLAIPGLILFSFQFGITQPEPEALGTLLEVSLIGPLLFLCLTDIKALELPDFANLVVGLLGILYLLLTPLSIWSGTLSALLLFIIFLSIALLSGGALGGGDIKYVLAFGFWIPPQHILAFLLFGTFTASIYGILALLISKKNEPLPFGPFLIFSSIYILYLF